MIFFAVAEPTPGKLSKSLALAVLRSTFALVDCLAAGYAFNPRHNAASTTHALINVRILLMTLLEKDFVCRRAPLFAIVWRARESLHVYHRRNACCSRHTGRAASRPSEGGVVRSPRGREISIRGYSHIADRTSCEPGRLLAWLGMEVISYAGVTANHSRRVGATSTRAECNLAARRYTAVNNDRGDETERRFRGACVSTPTC